MVAKCSSGIEPPDTMLPFALMVTLICSIIAAWNQQLLDAIWVCGCEHWCATDFESRLVAAWCWSFLAFHQTQVWLVHEWVPSQTEITAVSVMMADTTCAPVTNTGPPFWHFLHSVCNHVHLRTACGFAFVFKPIVLVSLPEHHAVMGHLQPFTLYSCPPYWAALAMRLPGIAGWSGYKIRKVQYLCISWSLTWMCAAPANSLTEFVS